MIFVCTVQGTKFHMKGCNCIWAIATKPKAKYQFCASTVLLFQIFPLKIHKRFALEKLEPLER